MKCPYCAEAIAEAAIVCKTCGRDLEFIMPLHRRVKELEARVELTESRIETTASRLDGTNDLDALKGPVVLKRGRLFMYVIWAMTITFVGNIFYWLLGSPMDDVSIGIARASLLLVGFWIGVRVQGRHLGSYVLFGALVTPLLAMAEYVGDAYFGFGAYSGEHFLYLLGSFFLDFDAMGVGAVKCALGGMVGDAVERVLERRPKTDGLMDKLSDRVRGLASPVPSSARAHATVASWMTALAPMLAFLGTVTAAYINTSGRRPEPKETQKLEIGGHNVTPGERDRLLQSIRPPAARDTTPADTVAVSGRSTGVP